MSGIDFDLVTFNEWPEIEKAWRGRSMAEEMVRPWCCKCDRPVDEFSMMHNFLLRNIVAVAKCHGKEDRKQFDTNFVAEIGVVGGLMFDDDGTLSTA